MQFQRYLCENVFAVSLSFSLDFPYYSLWQTWSLSLSLSGFYEVGTLQTLINSLYLFFFDLGGLDSLVDIPNFLILLDWGIQREWVLGFSLKLLE